MPSTKNQNGGSNHTSKTSPRAPREQKSKSSSNNSNYGNGGSNAGGKYYSGETIKVSGALEIFSDYGVIRQTEAIVEDLPKDVYISQSQIKRFSLRMGDVIEGYARAPKEGERYLSLLQVEKVAGLNPEDARKRPFFNKLTPIFPDEWMKLETSTNVISTRLIDLISPIFSRASTALKQTTKLLSLRA